jgi:cysteine synthase A
VGNTPLLAIDYQFRGRKGVVYAKAENLNMTGSVKDRMAFHILRQGYAKGALRLGHPVSIFMPDWMSPERVALIRCLGAEIHLVSKEEGGFLGSIERAEGLATSLERSFLPQQFANQDNVEAHARGTGPEIWWQLRFRSIQPDAFVAGVGTGGTIMGVGRFLRGVNPVVKLYPLEPSNSPTLSTGHRVGKHRIQGISDEFVPPIIDLSITNEVVSVDDGDAIVMAQMLATELGLGVGISSGANFLGAVQVQESLGADSVIVTIFPDDNKKYLSPDIRLLGFRGFKRVCHTCCDPLECEESLPAGIAEGEDVLPPCPRRY